MVVRLISFDGLNGSRWPACTLQPARLRALWRVSPRRPHPAPCRPSETGASSAAGAFFFSARTLLRSRFACAQGVRPQAEAQGSTCRAGAGRDSACRVGPAAGQRTGQGSMPGRRGRG